MKLFLTILLAVVAFNKYSDAAISAGCGRSIEDAAQCATSGFKSCFESNGCNFDPESMHGHGDGHDHDHDGHATCENNPMKFVMHTAMREAKPCMREEFSALSGKAQHFIKKMRKAMGPGGRRGGPGGPGGRRGGRRGPPRGFPEGGEDGMRQEMKNRIHAKVDEMCGSAADDVKQCLGQVKEQMKENMEQCMNDNVDQTCQDEVKSSVCNCMKEIDQNSPALNDALNCAKNVPNAPAMLRNMTPQRITQMIGMGCSMPTGVLRNMFRNRMANNRGNLFRRGN